MNLHKLFALVLVSLSSDTRAIQSVPTDIETSRNLENMQKLAEKVKSLISRYRT